MKHLKTFENINHKSKYKIGDYVIFKSKGIDIMPYKNYGHIHNVIDRAEDQYTPYYLYDIDFIDENDFEIKRSDFSYILEKFIIRKMTTEEIEDFKTVSESKKYNL